MHGLDTHREKALMLWDLVVKETVEIKKSQSTLWPIYSSQVFQLVYGLMGLSYGIRCQVSFRVVS